MKPCRTTAQHLEAAERVPGRSSTYYDTVNFEADAIEFDHVAAPMTESWRKTD